MEIRFGSYRLQARERQLWGPDGPAGIDGRTVEVLRALLLRPNALVLKDEIFSAVWPGMTVGENTLQVHISSLRKALGPEMIETVHGRGYKYRGPEPLIVSEPLRSRSVHGERPLLAVLPFRNVNGDADLGTFCDGLTCELIEQLSRFSLFSVVSHPVRTILPEEDANGWQATEGNGADFLLLGDVRRSGSRLRIASKLQDPRTRVVGWAEHHDREIGDFFAAFDELSGFMAGRINTRFETLMVSRQVSGRMLTSYDHLIKGIWHFRSETPDGPAVAEQMFRKARELNPANAEALRWLSIRMTCQWLSERKRDVLLDGLALGRAAAELDPASATCHAAHGFAQLWANGAESAAVSFQRAYAANPNDGYMLADVALCHLYCGRLEEGYAVLDRAEHLNPFPNDWHSLYRSIGRFSEGRYSEAIPGLRRMPRGIFGLVYLMSCYGHLGAQAEIEALAPRLRSMECDPVEAAREEPFADLPTRDRLAEGVKLSLDLLAEPR